MISALPIGNRDGIRETPRKQRLLRHDAILDIPCETLDRTH